MSSKPPEISRTAIRQILTLWDKVPDLGRHPLASLKAVEQRGLHSAHAETAVGMGLALKELMAEAIQLLKPSSAEPDPHDRNWRPYFFVKLRYVEGRIPEWIMVEMAVSNRTFYRELRIGLERIADQFRHWEEAAQRVKPAAKPDKIQTSAVLAPPPLPLQPIIERSALFKEAHALLNGSLGRAVAIQGLPGAGKTTLASQLATDPLVRSLFSDGVIWVGLGPSPDILDLLQKIALHIGMTEQEIAKFDDSRSIGRAIASAIYHGKWLIVLDDVWQLEDATYFNLAGEQSKLLVTTRKLDLALEAADGNLVKVQAFDPNQGKLFLTKLAPDLAESVVEELFQMAGGLPLTLLILGKYIRKQGYGGQRSRLELALERLRDPGERVNLPLPTQSLGSRSAEEDVSLAAVLELSVSSLNEGAGKMLPVVALFPPKPNSFTIDAVLEITGSDATSFHEIVDAGLIEPAQRDRYTLHQSVHDCLIVKFSPGQRSNYFQNFLRYYADLCEQESFGEYTTVDPEQVNVAKAISLAEAHQLTKLHLFRLAFIFSRFLIDRGRIDDAEQLISNLSTLEPLDDPCRARLLISQGYVANAQNQAPVALEKFIEGYSLADHIGDHNLALRGKVIALKMHLRVGDHASARVLAIEINKLIEGNRDPVWRASAHLALSGINYYLSEYEAAFSHINSARRLYQQRNRPVPGAIYMNLGAISVELGRYSDSFMYYELALERFKQTDQKYRMAQIHNNFGVASVRVGRWLQGLDHYQAALAIHEEINDLDILEQTLLNLSVLYLAQRDIGMAAQTIQKGLEISKESQYLSRRSRFLVNQATLFSLEHRLEEAADSVAQGLAIAGEIDHDQIKAEALLGQGAILGQAGQIKEGVAALKAAEAICLEIGQKPYLTDAQVQLAWLNLKLGAVEEAVKYGRLAETYIQHQAEGLEDPGQALLLMQSIAELDGRSSASEQYGRKFVAYMKQQAQQITSSEVRVQFHRRLMFFKDELERTLTV